MSWRGLHISKPAKLSLKHSQLKLCQENGNEITFAMEDMAYIILDTPQVTITGALLAACAQHGCLVMTTDSKHMPNGTLLPFHGYHRQLHTVHKQLTLSAAQKKRMWQAIIQSKITNQSENASRQGNPLCHRYLLALVKKVKSGDPDNVESTAARLYWKGLFSEFTRDQDSLDRRNGLLNYAYALLRSALARNLSAMGFVPSVGIHHKNKQNAFNLADDCIEPWRPVADEHVCAHLANHPEGETVTLEDRQAMTSLFTTNIQLGEEVVTVLHGLRRYIESFHSVLIRGSTNPMLFPQLSVTNFSSGRE
ncbi:type II CRISPR-associated endonuclease Cas1 [Halodesulfovibrio sp.]|jgi:CRISPR-associated protein Cas1|uniref:type II CRISPR-associated endonuclease Cas1 n=1 Tax=Halodesulfovibrio sp. TaxID=1912772 RepID=UPI0025D037E9|nr:type II CRISPR-associated endonuclease Cas1 [Halodesulfovibrio sp.]MCT4533779.1 type II CRISPR-associated endonuclease Cas1 [Halodesulfovibrio sp.]